MTLRKPTHQRAASNPVHVLERRRLIQGLAAVGAGLLASSRDRFAGGAVHAGRRGLTYRGINYDTGTNYFPGSLSREVWHTPSVARDIETIRGTLHANSIGIFGTELDRLAECSALALQNGLQVWLQPRLIEASPDAMLAHLSDAAHAAERLRGRGAVTLNIGCELSLFMSGLIPGTTFFERITALGGFSDDQFVQLSRRLDDHVQRARTVARAHFTGPLTYSAGSWEWIDWSSFDVVGVNHYRDASNRSTYVEELRGFRRHRKPVVVTEFGCCTYEGAADAGGGGWEIVDWSKPVPELEGSYIRSESEQARYIDELLTVFEAERIDGAFVYCFADTGLPHSPDPRRDLDMASYGVVKVLPQSPGVADVRWEPKQAFHELARRYAEPGAPSPR